MHQLLEDLRDAWSPEDKDARNEVVARAKADEYVRQFPEQYVGYEKMAVPDLVRAIDLFREAGMEHDQWKVEAWLLHHFLPQQIGGEYNAQVRTTS